MYVAVLNTQKGVLQEDSDKLRRELHNGKHIFHRMSLHVILAEIRPSKRIFAQSPEVFLGPCQTSMMELFARIVNGF